jgi:hypothetical protein
MAVKVRKVGDKKAPVKKLAGKAKRAAIVPFSSTGLSVQIWNPASDDTCIWNDATSFYAYGVYSPTTAALTAWVVDDLSGNELFRTTSFLTPPYPAAIPPGANWACLCTGLTQGNPGTFNIQASDGTHVQICSAHFSIVEQPAGPF